MRNASISLSLLILVELDIPATCAINRFLVFGRFEWQRWVFLFVISKRDESIKRRSPKKGIGEIALGVL